MRRSEHARANSSQRVARTSGLARLGARTAADLATTRVRSALVEPHRRAELEADFELRTAAQVVEVLGNMKGAMMKLGQMASYLDQGLPEAVRATLAELQSAAPPMSIDLVRGVIRSELGGEPEEVFASFEPDPMAAASIGQVHRAVTLEGSAVAVKVQYPGVDEAIRADLANSDLLFGMLGMLFPGLDPKPLVSELRERITEELDYRAEARHQARFAAYYQGHPYIAVPEVYSELSTGRVLTTALAQGATWSELLGWSQQERNLAAETIFRFAFGGIYRLGTFNGDPHPGNYLFQPGGHVTFLDYGLCKTFTEAELSGFTYLIEAMVLDHDPLRFAAIAGELGLLDDSDRFSSEEIDGYFRHFYEPVMTDDVVTLTPAYAAESIRRFFDMTSPHINVMKASNLPPAFVIVQRINLGLFALLAELAASANWRRIAEEIWPNVDGPPSTPMGVEIAAWAAARSTSKPDASKPDASTPTDASRR